MTKIVAEELTEKNMTGKSADAQGNGEKFFIENQFQPEMGLCLKGVSSALPTCCSL